MFRKHCAMSIILTAGLLLGSGCSQAGKGRTELEVSVTSDASDTFETQEDGWENREDAGELGSGEAAPVLESSERKAREDAGQEEEKEDEKGEKAAEDRKKQFGEDCIGEQTFEVELSEYNGAVWFVPFAPGLGNGDFRMHLIQNDNVLAALDAYVPEELAGEPFGSLDAVSFYDINFDGNTDILLIETYGNTTFAAVYYGFDRDGEDYERYFTVQDELSRQITAQVKELTVPGIRKFLGDTRKNGRFAGYQEAYQAVGQLWQRSQDNVTFDLIYVDKDETPELAAGVEGYYVSLYTYSDGKVYTLMDQWSYGAMGNAGYEYAPKKNNLRNYNADYAGAIVYTTYMAVKEDHSLETVAEIKTVNFDDANENGVLDEEEMDSVGYYGVSYLNGQEASEAEFAGFDAGEYGIIHGTMSLKELEMELKGR